MKCCELFVKHLTSTQVQRDADRRLAAQHVRAERAGEGAAQRAGAAGARVAAAPAQEAEREGREGNLRHVHEPQLVTGLQCFY